jgi:hypothetical protein
MQTMHQKAVEKTPEDGATEPTIINLLRTKQIYDVPGLLR